MTQQDPTTAATTSASRLPALPSTTTYSVERHGSGWAIYQGRDAHHHGFNLGHLSECSDEIAARVERGLKLLDSAENDVVIVPRALLQEHIAMLQTERNRHMQPGVVAKLDAKISAAMRYATLQREDESAGVQPASCSVGSQP